MPKRGRWDSSSDEEDTGKQKATTTKKKGQQGNGSTTTSVPATTTVAKKNKSSLQKQQQSQKQPQPPGKNYKYHNPLLQGCRSVYDTYDKISHISEGTYGIVWKAKDLATKEIVALKQIKFDIYDGAGEEGTASFQSEEMKLARATGFPVTALREISVLLELQHDCIVNVKEMVVGGSTNTLSGNQVFMVMEYMELDLQVAIQRFRQYPNLLRQSELKSILQQILRGVAYMHTNWYLHRDLKSSNILVHRSGRVAICDLGLTRKYSEPQTYNLTQLVCTLWYRCPELLFGECKYGPPVDNWSIGCIFGELLLEGTPILQGQGELDQIDQIFTLCGMPTEESWPNFTNLPNSKIFRWNKPEKQTKAAKSKTLQARFQINTPIHVRQTFLDGNGYNLLSQLLTLNPATRITAQDALNHPYFTQGVTPILPNFFEDMT